MAVLGEGCQERPELTLRAFFFAARNSSRFGDESPSGHELCRGGSGGSLDFKNGVDRGYDLVHGCFDIEREADEVHLLQRRIRGNQDLPCRTAAKIDTDILFLTVPQIADAAQQIAEMNQTGQRSGSRQKVGIVVTAGAVSQFLG